MHVNRTLWNSRLWLLISLAAVCTVGHPIAAQPNPNDPPAIEVWIEDLSPLLSPSRRGAHRMLGLRTNELRASPADPADPDDTGAMSHDAIEEYCFRVLTDLDGNTVGNLRWLDATRLLIAVPTERKSDVIAALSELRQMAGAGCELTLTALTFTRAAWLQLRQHFREHLALNSTDLGAWIAAQPANTGAVTVGATRRSWARHGDTVELSRIARQPYVSTYSLETANNMTVATPTPAMLDDGYSLSWSPHIIRDGALVVLNLGFSTAKTLGQIEMSGKGVPAFSLPSQSTCEFSSSLLMEPGKQYVVSTGPVASSDCVQAFALKVTITGKRLAEVPALPEPGLMAVNYDGAELTLAHRRAVLREIRPGKEFERPWLEPECDPIDLEAILPTMSESLYADLNHNGSFVLGPFGYFRVAAQPISHDELKAALVLLRGVLGQRFATEIAAWRTTAAQTEKLMTLSAPLTPAQVREALGDIDYAAACVTDITLWHRLGDVESLWGGRESAFIAGFSPAVGESSGGHSPEIGILHQGMALGLCITQSGETWQLHLRGNVTAWDGKLDSSSTEPNTGLPLHRPRVSFSNIDERVNLKLNEWVTLLLDDPEEPTRTLLMLVRVRSVAK